MEAVRRTQNILSRIIQHNDYLIAVGVIGVLVMMIIPLPTFILDVLLASNIAISIVILMVSMYTQKTVEFSVFPGLLLVITLFRLSLNVASTRLILGEADAGVVINAFGTFVTKGNAVVGFIIFIILVVIQFVVITKGSGRIAEVAARFTLDAMPGKQMAVDADLNAGLITENQARERRDIIRREADFYGAMDGASKFVRGDAVAGLIITGINLVGGFVIGMAQLGMGFTEALSTYSRLTIGDGLVQQMPALIVSTAAGIIVTRAASESNLGSEITRQLMQSPKALYIASAVTGFFSLVPGLPFFPFLLLSMVTGTTGYLSSKGILLPKVKPEEEKKPVKAEEKIEDYLSIDQMEMEIGYGLIPLVDTAQGGDLLERITMVRRQLATDLGIIVPPIRIRDNIQLKPNQYRVKIKNVPIAGGELMSGCYLAMSPGKVKKDVKGVKTKEPAFGLPALWITQSQKEEAESSGYTVVELPAVIATHLTEVIKGHSAEILNRQDVKRLIDNAKEANPTAVEELVPGKMAVGEVQKVLQNLLREKVSVRDLGTVLEILSDHVEKTKNVDVLSEYVRDGLARQITDQYKEKDGTLRVVTVDPKLEQLLEVSMQQTDRGNKLVLRPEMATKILEKVGEEAGRLMSQNIQPVLLTSPLVRAQFRRMIEQSHPHVSVLSYNEVAAGVNIQSIGMVKVD